MISVLRRSVVPLAWAVVAVLVGVCVLRFLGLTRWYWEIAAQALTAWILLPAWPIALVGGVRRHWALSGSAAAIIACQIVWVGPQFKPWNSAAAPAGPQRLRLFDANVSQSNLDVFGIAAEIEAARPEVLTLEELTPRALVSFQTSGALSGFGYREVRAESGAGGMGLWSTLPLSGVTSWDNEGGQTELEGTVAFAGHEVRVAVAHVFAPVGANQPAMWRGQLDRLTSHLKAQPRPLVVAGDFNATADLPQFRHILDDGLSDTAVLAGQGWRMTWPRNQAWVLPYLRIDHVLLSPQLTETSYRLGTGRGSDHKPLIVEIALTH